MPENTKEKVSYKKYVGYKFYKVIDKNTAEMIRVIRVYEDNTMKILLEDGSTKNISAGNLKDYTPLEPTGLMMFNILLSGETFDVMVTAYKLIEVKMGDNNPYVLCRQGVRDFFFDLCCKGDPEVENKMVGVSVCRDTCPANLNINQLTACDFVVDSKMVHFYKEDNLDTILKCVGLAPFEKIMKLNFENHIKSLPNYNPLMLEKKEDHGWCKDLKHFLQINNFMQDVDLMQGITDVDFVLERQLIESPDGSKKLNNLALTFFDYSFKVNAVDTRVINYDNTINLGDFNNENYYLIRDSVNELYIIVYLVEGEYLESELEERMNTLSVSDKLRLSYYNKYSKYQKEAESGAIKKVEINQLK